MARNEARRQKQLAKKKAKRQEKRAHLARVTSPDPTIQLADAGSWPIEETLVPENLWTEGIGHLVISRRQPSGRLVCGVYLVDTYCLGVKKAFWRTFTSSDYQQLLYDLGKVGRHERVAPEYFAKLVQEAAAYAQSFGFAPHPDYRQRRGWSWSALMYFSVFRYVHVWQGRQAVLRARTERVPVRGSVDLGADRAGGR